VRTLVFLKNGAFTDNFEYDLEGTACEGVIAGSLCYYAAHTHELFYKEKGVESYLGLPIHNTEGEVLGHLAVYDTRPMPQTLNADVKAVLEIFAARAGAELDRLRTLRDLQAAREALEQQVRERTAALRASEQAYRDLYEEAPNVYISVGTDGLIRRANHRAEELFGYPLEQLKGQPIFNFMTDTPLGKPKGRELFNRFVAGLESLNEELELQRADGQLVICSVSVRPIANAQGQVEASRSIYVDITARKKAEAERERLIADLDAFAHTVAHDLKNPLTGILAYAELLQTDWADDTARANAGHLYPETKKTCGRRSFPNLNRSLQWADDSSTRRAHPFTGWAGCPTGY
jgi:PAS domain S-box-containing protein